MAWMSFRQRSVDRDLRGPQPGYSGSKAFLAPLLVALALTFALVPMSVAPVSAQQASPNAIAAIEIEGNQRIDGSTILSYLTVRPGDIFDTGTLDDSLTSLFNTGLFADVALRREGSVLVINVVENPIINQIAFEGNRRLDDDVLGQEVELRARVVYTRTRVQSDVARLLEIYRRSGRFAATVEPKIIELDQNRVDLVFEIDEGPLTGVQRISFVGNQAYGDSRLRTEIQTRESRFWRILTSDDGYDPDRVAFDRELLRRFYLNQGYADFRVASTVAELTEDRERFFLTFTVEEGERYAFGEIDVISFLPDLDSEVLMDDVTSRPGDWYSAEEVERTIEALTSAVGDLQYAFVDVRPLVTRDRENRLINITFEINEGPRVFVERIDINGNIRTEDRVIRREFALVEGDPFNASRLSESERNIRRLDFFQTVEIESIPGSQPDQTVIEVNVEEKSTGSISLGAGFSSADGPLGLVELRERNLLGRGQDLALSLSISGVTQQADVSFTEPYFLGRDLSAGVDAFRINRNLEDVSSFDQFQTGFGLRMGYPIAPNLRQTLGYRLELNEITNLQNNASLAIREQEGTTLTSLVSQNLAYDTTDSILSPTEGLRLSYRTALAGVGGDVAYIQNSVSAQAFHGIFDDNLVFEVGSRVANITGLGESTRVTDRFFLGGQNLRGFRRAGVGPRDIGTDDALGGNTLATGRVQAMFSIGLPDEWGIRGRTFSDVGTLFDPDSTTQINIEDDASIRSSVGVGVSWVSPFGPVALDFALPVTREDYDQTESISFSFGTAF